MQDKRALLRLEAVEVFYGHVRGLHPISIAVSPGEIVSLLGPNGAGKSTTLRAISGLVPPRKGRVYLDGEDITGLRPDKIARKGIAHVPEGRRVFAALTVEENLEVAAGAIKTARRGAASAIAKVYELFPRLDERKSQLAWSLSGGEQQMLAIGRAMVAQARVIVLDEPSLGLAPQIVKQVMNALRDIRDMTTDTGILLVEQNAKAALSISDRAYVLSSGKILAEGDAKEIAERSDLALMYVGGKTADGERAADQ